MKKIVCVLCYGILGISLVACGKSSDKSTEVVNAVSPDMTDVSDLDNIMNAECTPSSENAILNDLAREFEGQWQECINEKCTMNIASESDVYTINICCQDSETTIVWELSGEYDEERKGISYKGSRTEIVESEENEVHNNCIYEDGTGLIYFSDDDSLCWIDDIDNYGADYVFERQE